MDDILNQEYVFSFAKNWIPKLLRELLNKSQLRKDEINKLSDIFGDPIELAKYYIEPDCQQFNPADYDEDEDRYIVREPIFSRIQNFLSGRSVTGGNQLFVLADSGMGKTSFLMMLKLAYINSFWPKGLECLLLKLGHDTIEQIRKISGCREKILLLDGLDEDPLAFNQIQNRIRQLLLETKNFRRVVITCRTQFFSGGEDPFNRRGQVEISGVFCPVLYLSLFNSEQVKKYCEKRFPNRPDMVARAEIVSKKMKSLRCRPMLLAHIEDILDSQNIEWTEFSIYEALIKVWLHREHFKMSQREQKKKPPTVNDLWNACKSLAVTFQEENIRSIDHVGLENFIRYNSLIRHIPTMDFGGRSLLNKNSMGEYRFSHYSIQEFLVTHALIKGNIKSKSLTKKIAWIRPTDQMISFMLSVFESTPLEERHKIPLFYFNLNNIILRNLDLRNAAIQAGKIERADLQRCNLEGANLKLSNLKGSNLQFCNFKGANLEGADLSESNLEGSNLDCANLKKANLTSAKLQGASLDNADLEGAILEGADLSESNLEGSNLDSANLKKANLTSAKLQGTSLVSADIEAAKLNKANLESAVLKKANLRNAKLEGANLSSACLTNAILLNSDFSKSQLRNADLTGCDLTGSKFKEANLEGAKIDPELAGEADFAEATNISQEFRLKILTSKKRLFILNSYIGEKKIAEKVLVIPWIDIYRKILPILQNKYDEKEFTLYINKYLLQMHLERRPEYSLGKDSYDEGVKKIQKDFSDAQLVTKIIRDIETDWVISDSGLLLIKLLNEL